MTNTGMISRDVGNFELGTLNDEQGPYIVNLVRLRSLSDIGHSQDIGPSHGYR